MKKLLIVLSSFMVTAGALNAGRDPLAAYSSGALLVAAAKQAPKDVQNLAQDLAQGVSTFVQDAAVPFVVNNREDILKTAAFVAVAGGALYLARTTHPIEAPVEVTDSAVKTDSVANSSAEKKSFLQRFFGKDLKNK